MGIGLTPQAWVGQFTICARRGYVAFVIDDHDTLDDRAYYL